MENIYFNTTPASEVKFHGGLQSEVNTPNLICLFCFIFREAHFPPHISWEIGEKQQEERVGVGVGDPIKKHGVLYCTWSCFIISWSSSDTSYDGVVVSGGGVCMCEYVQWLLVDGWVDSAEPIQMSNFSVILSISGFVGGISFSWQCDNWFHRTGVSTRRGQYATIRDCSL